MSEALDAYLMTAVIFGVVAIVLASFVVMMADGHRYTGKAVREAAIRAQGE